MRNNTIKMAAAGLLLLMGGCQDDPGKEITGGSGNTVPVEFTIATKPYEVPRTNRQTRTYEADGFTVTLGLEAPERPETRVNEENVDESKITHLYILQFTVEAEDYDSTLEAITEVTSADLTEKSTGVYTFTADLLEMTNSRLIFLANLEDNATIENQVYTGMSLSSFKQRPLIFDSDGAIVDGDIIPMYGEITSPVPFETSQQVEMDRMAAKIDLTVNYNMYQNNGYLKIDTLRLMNVPRISSFHDPSENSPENNRSNFFNYDPIFPLPEDESAQRQISARWYIPQNLRGEGTNTELPQDEKKKSRFTVPGGMGGAYITTHIHMGGSFVKDGDSPTNDRYTSINLFPGADIYNDFNIRRNHYYIITATIANADFPSEDKRIEIEELYGYVNFIIKVDDTDGEILRQNMNGYIVGETVEYNEMYYDGLPAQIEEDGKIYIFKNAGTPSSVTVEKINSIQDPAILEIYYEEAPYQVNVLYQNLSGTRIGDTETMGFANAGQFSIQAVRDADLIPATIYFQGGVYMYDSIDPDDNTVHPADGFTSDKPYVIVKYERGYYVNFYYRIDDSYETYMGSKSVLFAESDITGGINKDFLTAPATEAKYGELFLENYTYEEENYKLERWVGLPISPVVGYETVTLYYTLDVQMEKSDRPTISTVRVGDFTLYGEGIPGAIITVRWPNGTTTQNIEVPMSGYWSAAIPITLEEYQRIIATQTEPGKSVSEEAETTVLGRW